MLAILLLVQTLSGAPSGQQFDLVCKGSEDVPSVRTASIPWSVRLSVDLDRRLINFGGAHLNRAIVAITPTRLEFSRGGSSEQEEAWIDRLSGKFFERTKSEKQVVQLTRQATCTAAPFTNTFADEILEGK